MTAAVFALLGALVGGAIAFAGAVYTVRIDLRERRRRERFDVFARFLAGVDAWAAELEDLSPSRLGRILAAPSQDHWLALRANLTDAGAAAGLVAPDHIRVLAREAIAFLIEWSEQPGPGNLEAWGEARQRLGDAIRPLVGVNG